MTQDHTMTDGPRPRGGRVPGALVASMYDIISDAPDGVNVGLDVTLRRYAIGIDLVKVEISIDDGPATLTGIVTRNTAKIQGAPYPAAHYRMRYDDGTTRRTVTVRGPDAMLHECADYSIDPARGWLLYRWVTAAEAVLNDEARTCGECGTTTDRPAGGWSDTRDAGWVHCDYCGSQLS